MKNWSDEINKHLQLANDTSIGQTAVFVLLFIVSLLDGIDNAKKDKKYHTSFF